MLTGKPSGKRPLGRPWRRWETNRMDLKDIVGGIALIREKNSDYWRMRH